jgi:hypothetical protein
MQQVLALLAAPGQRDRRAHQVAAALGQQPFHLVLDRPARR